jgi:hypothetical protein
MKKPIYGNPVDAKPVMWRADPIWDRMGKQASWGKLLRLLSFRQKVGVEIKWSFIYRGYHCEMFRVGSETGYARQFVSEGYGLHPLGALRDALSLVVKIDPLVRTALVEALVDYLQEEIEKHGLLRGEG